MTDPSGEPDDLAHREPYDDPFEWFGDWFGRARQLDLDYPNAVTLATVSESGQPRARTVLLKEWDRDGFVFYTNYDSDKARDIRAAGRAAMQVHWQGLDRQFRVEGRTERLAEAASDAYFSTRPRASKIGAWASEQSRPLDSREDLTERFREYEEGFDGEEVSRPSNWGGYRIEPVRFVFWRAGADRLHDRWEFVRREDGKEDRMEEESGWRRQRLNP